MPRYYFKRGATKVFHNTVAAVAKAAQAYSDEIGRSVPVFSEGSTKRIGTTVRKSTYSKNPATKASKARKKASNKRGAYVEYIDGTKKVRKHFQNRGIATIRAAALKRDGYRGVRLVSA